METIAERLKKIRTDLELNQIEFSKKIGVTNAHISRMEKGITIPSEALIKLICKEFCINEEWLKMGSGPMYIEELEFYTDILLNDSTNQFNKLLRNKNENVRYRAAQLNSLFAEITNVNDLGDNTKIIFLDLLIDLFSTVQKYNTPIKDRLANKQLIFDDILDMFFEQYKQYITQNIDNFKKKLVEIILK
ncbi:helix-turn-helix transcriptional regulator [Lachnospiraceae bacterium 54-11]